MSRGTSLIGVLILAALLVAATASAQVPTVVKFSGVLTESGGARIVAATFSMYADPRSDTPLWQETQPIAVDVDGRYAVLLGTTQPGGIPATVFANGEARWIGVAVEGQVEQGRVALVSVPYALKAEDATTVGGKPLSAFVLAGDRTGVGPDGLTYVNARVLTAGLGGPPPPQGGSGAASAATAGTANYLALFTDATNLGNSAFYQTPAGRVGVNTTAPTAPFHLVSTEQPSALFDTYSGVNVLGTLPVVYRAARGTPTTPAAVQTDDILGGLAVRGFNGTAFTGGRGQVMFKAAENWTTIANGTYLSFATEPIGAATLAAERMRILADGRVGIGTTAPEQLLTVNGVVQSTTGGFKFPDGTAMLTAVRLGANTFTATQTISNGNLMLPSTAGSSSGVVWIGGEPFLHASGGATNTFLGSMAGDSFTTTGAGNVGVGYEALRMTTSGSANTAVGSQAMQDNTTGFNNTAVGANALAGNLTGTWNTAVGTAALQLNSANANTALGALTLTKNTSGMNNVAAGHGALLNNTIGGDNAAVGSQALLNNTEGTWNTAVGAGAAQLNSTGQSNTAMGHQALYSNQVGAGNSAFGALALGANSASSNSAFGYQALQSNTTGQHVTAVGAGALRANTTGSNNTAVGEMSLYTNVVGTSNSAFGSGALQTNSSDANSAFGFGALQNTSSGNSNTAVGSRALNANTTGYMNTAVGAQALAANTTGIANAAFGSGALKSNTADANTAVGYNALTSSTSGVGNTAMGNAALYAATTASHNTAVGFVALSEVTTASNNTALGSYALTQDDTGYSNTAIGYTSLSRNSSASSNTAVGAYSMSENDIGDGNTAVGYSALKNGVNGDGNAAFGTNALSDITAGAYNTAAGYLAGNYVTTGDHNTFLGYNARAASTLGTIRYSGAIGAHAIVAQDNAIVLGGTGSYAVNVGINTQTPDERLQVAGDIKIGTSGTNGCLKNYSGAGMIGTCSSDMRLKTNIQPFGRVLDRVARLQPVHFTWRANEFPTYRFGDGLNVGLIAQEVEQEFPELVQTDERGFKTVNYTELPYLTLAAVKELKAENDALKARNAALESKLDALADRVARLEKK
jgi:trimeric autotransporter adhesin